MQPIFYVMAILGCGDGGNCESARVAETYYPSAAACRAATADALIAHTDLDYPVLRADCRKASKPAALRKG